MSLTNKLQCACSLPPPSYVCLFVSVCLSLIILLNSSHHSEIVLSSVSSLPLALNKAVQFSSDFGRPDIHSYFNVHTENKYLSVCSAVCCWFWGYKAKKIGSGHPQASGEYKHASRQMQSVTGTHSWGTWPRCLENLASEPRNWRLSWD